MDRKHSLLERQVKRHFGSLDAAPKDCHGFIEAVNTAYREFDADRAMLERSLELSSQELLQANSDVRAVSERIITSSLDGILAFDGDGRYTVWNPGMERMTGLKKEETLGRHALGISPFFNEAEQDTLLYDVLAGKATFIKEKKYIVTETGRQGFFEGHVSPLHNKSGKIIGGLAIIRDITDRKQAEQALADQSTHDALTNLYNRRYFNQRMELEIAQADRNKHSLAILLCDLDNFKALNDAKGHEIGDNTLKAVAKTIQDATRGSDLVFRWGGDEIVVGLTDTARKGVLIASERIRRGVQKIGERIQCELDLSIGVALYPEHGTSIDQLMRLADRALYIAKKGGDKIHIGEEEYHLDEHSIKIVYQPVVDIRSRQHIGYEALSRDPQGKLSILELFRKYQAIGHLNELKYLCFTTQLHAAEQARLERVFINIDFNVLEQHATIKKPPGVDVILEISEVEALHEFERRLQVTKMWREKGFKFAIDDFGAGFISLPFVSKLVPEYIKLDRSTILHAVASEKFRMFLKDLVRALQNYSTEGIIAEGIETNEELEVVTAMGIHLAQGFLLGKPQELQPVPTARQGSQYPPA